MCPLFHCLMVKMGEGCLLSHHCHTLSNEACLGCWGGGRKIVALLILLSRSLGGGALEGIMKSDEQE